MSNAGKLMYARGKTVPVMVWDPITARATAVRKDGTWFATSVPRWYVEGAEKEKRFLCRGRAKRVLSLHGVDEEVLRHAEKIARRES